MGAHTPGRRAIASRSFRAIRVAPRHEEVSHAALPQRAGARAHRARGDVVLPGTGAEAVALDCAVHPDGPEAHVERHRTLRRAGWRVVDAFASRWDGDAAAAAVELRTELA